MQDMTLRYKGSNSHSATCDGFFQRPKVMLPPAAGLRGTATFVYYSGRFWTRDPVAVQAATVPSADSLRACLRPAYWRDRGPSVIGGVDAREFAATAKLPGNAGPGYEHLWVNTATYLPIRLVTFNGAEKITFGFKFLPPTSANKGLLRLKIPVGFVKRRF